MKDYYVSPYSMGISYAFINALCTLTGDNSLNVPQKPISYTFLRNKLSELSCKHGIKVTWFTDAFNQREINQIAKHLIDNSIINESEFLRITEDFLKANPEYLMLPSQLAELRKPLY